MNTENTNTETNANTSEDVKRTVSNAGVSEEAKSNLSVNNKINSQQDEQHPAHKSKVNVRNPEEYIVELREENKHRRLAEEKAREELDQLKSELNQTKKLFESEKKRADEIRIFSELKTEAIKAGINDIDDVYKLADMSQVIINERGEVNGAASVIDQLKNSKPYLFRENNSTSLGNVVPHPKKDAGAVSNEKLKPEEYEQRLQAIKQKYR